MFKKSDENKFLHAQEYTHIPKLRLAGVTLLCLFFCAFCGVLYFSYDRIYATMGRIEYINSLQASMFIETINFDRLEKVRAEWAKKHSTVIPTKVYDPFFSTSTSATAGQKISSGVNSSL